MRRRGLSIGIAVAAGALLGWVAAGGGASRESGAVARAAAPSWIRGNADERFARIEAHLRGLDVAMAEIGYRYTELHFAVQDRNWDYADYQMGKIELALRLAVERRPKRASSATAFLTDDWPAVQAGVRSRRPDSAEEALGRLRAACMRCHASEQVPYFTLDVPEHRLSPIRLGQGR